MTPALLAVVILSGILTATAHAAPAQPQVAMGDAFTVLIKPNGSLFTWGNNQYGQLGLGSFVYRRTRPVRVGTAYSWAQVATGGWHVLALKTDGSLWAWGNNPDGRLGLGDTEKRWVPTRVGDDNDWVAVAAGLRCSFALKANGTLWAWGANGHGQLGLGDTASHLSPSRVGRDNDWAAVDGGGTHTVAIKTDGTLWVWGANFRSQLGLPGTSDRPVPAQLGEDNDWVAVSCSDDDTRATKQDRTLWAWGYNSFGQLGLGDRITRTEPTEVGDLWHQLACCDDSTLATHPDGSLWAWGDNTYGQLGQGDRDYRTAPTQVGGDADWDQLVSGHDHVAALKQDGSFWVWGKNRSAQLGLGDTADRLLPVLAFYVTDFTPPTIVSLISTTHPDDAAWYADPFPAFSWQASADQSNPARYSRVLNRTASTTPTPLANATEATWTAPETADGVWYLHVRAADSASNWGPTVTRRVKIDTTPPVTTTDAPASWRRIPVTVHLTAADAGAGVAETQYRLDGGSWKSDTQVTVSGEGAHALLFRSADALGTVEASRSVTVRIDTRRPTTLAPRSARVRRGSRVALAYKVADPRPGSPTANVTIRIKTLAGKTVKQVTLRDRKVNTLLAHRFSCSLAKRTYRFFVYARDKAGNVQVKVGSNKLVVF